jgi:predicted deacylase
MDLTPEQPILSGPFDQTRQLAAALETLSCRSDFLLCRPLESGDGRCALPKFVFEGPDGGGDPIRIGLFSAIHGDEQAGAHAILRLCELLVQSPKLAEGYHLHLYPVCNPAGFEKGSRYSSTGKDLNREFWKQSDEPEVQLLEREIEVNAFHGLVSLHADDTSGGIYGFVRGALLTRSLLEPALATAERHLPRNCAAEIDGFSAQNGIIGECYQGILTAPPKLENSPFEIIFETPQLAPAEKQVAASVAAILTVLAEYRKFISFAADL